MASLLDTDYTTVNWLMMFLPILIDLAHMTLCTALVFARLTIQIPDSSYLCNYITDGFLLYKHHQLT